MRIEKGMYILRDTLDMDDWYEIKISELFIITDEDDLKLALYDQLKFLGYTVVTGAEIIAQPVNGKHYEVKVDVAMIGEAEIYECYLMNIPSAKEALGGKFDL